MTRTLRITMNIRIFDIKLYHNSEGLDFDEAYAIITELNAKNYYDVNFITNIFENVNFVNCEINFVSGNDKSAMTTHGIGATVLL